MITLSRRRLFGAFGSLLAAPAIVKIDSLMKIGAPRVPGFIIYGDIETDAMFDLATYGTLVRVTRSSLDSFNKIVQEHFSIPIIKFNKNSLLASMVSSKETETTVRRITGIDSLPPPRKA